MIAQLCWIGAVYGLAALAIHALHARESRQRACSGGEGGYILITRNHQDVVEWYIRALGLLSLLGGGRMRTAVEDCGSSDATLDIVRRLEGRCQVELEIRTGRTQAPRRAGVEESDEDAAYAKDAVRTDPAIDTEAEYLENAGISSRKLRKEQPCAIVDLRLRSRPLTLSALRSAWADGRVEAEQPIDAGN